VALDVWLGKVELDGDHALAGRGLKVLEDALVPRVVGDHELEPGSGAHRNPAEPFEAEFSPMVGEGVDCDDGVLPCLHHFVEVADATVTHGPGQWAVHP